MDESALAIHHVGIAVPSIDDAMHFYGDKLGLSLVDSVDLPDRQLKVAFVQAANMLIELLEPTDPNSTVSRFLERRGPGLHHLCFGTPDIRRHLRDLEDKGVELIDTAPRPGAHGEVAFLQPSAGLGVLVELIQPTDRPLDGVQAPANATLTEVAEPPTVPAADATVSHESLSALGSEPSSTETRPAETTTGTTPSPTPSTATSGTTETPSPTPSTATSGTTGTPSPAPSTETNGTATGTPPPTAEPHD